jgi:hypothetical protein
MINEPSMTSMTSRMRTTMGMGRASESRRTGSSRATSAGPAAAMAVVPWGRRERRVLALAAGLALICLALASAPAEAAHRYHGFRYHYHPRLSFSFGYPYYPYPVYGSPYAGYGSADMGALDLAVKPKKATVYLDGQQIGRVKNYDGWPRYLWLEQGDHQLVFHLEGYRTHVESVRVQRGIVMKLAYRLVEGQATPPEQVFEPKAATERATVLPAEGRRAAPEVQSRDDAWRERQPVDPDVRTTPGQLRIKVEPADAVVYVDGRLIGSGEELARLHAPLVVDPGTHVIEVVRPGYATRRLDVEASSGEEVWLEVALELRDR